MVDMAHFAGLVAAGLYPSPLPHAHVVTTTTHKTLRGPRGGMILTNDAELGKKINSAVFPGLQGGPLMHVIAGKAAAFGEALRPEFRAYQKAVAENARVLAATLVEQGLAIVTGGTDSHLMLVDLRPKRVTGKAAEASLERAHITANKNAIPFDPEKPAITSGIRLGTPGRHHARLRRGRVPRDRPDDRRGAGRAWRAPTTAPTTRGRAGGGRARAGAVRALPDLSGDGKPAHALPVLRPRRHPGEGQPPHRGRRGDPPPPLLRHCGQRFTTIERVQLRELTVVKSDGRRVPFDRDKLARSIRIALRKRPVQEERIERIVNGIVRQLEASGESDIPSKQIGELVMETLKEVDAVAYVRFASVYRNFREAKDFEAFLGSLGEPT